MAFQNMNFVNFPGGTARGPLSPDANGFVYLNENTMGNGIRQAAAVQVQCTADFVVDVMGPMGCFMNDAPYVPYPGPQPAAGGPNDVVVIRGRWHSLRVTTAGEVYVLIDTYNGSY